MVSSDKFYLSTSTMGFPRQPDADNIDGYESGIAALTDRVDTLETDTAALDLKCYGILSTLDTTLKYQRILTADDNMDDLLESGIYAKQVDVPVNFPFDRADWAIVIVFFQRRFYNDTSSIKL